MPEQAPPGYATLVIFREKGFTGSFRNHAYYVNDTFVALLGTHTYTYISIKGGRTSVQWAVSMERGFIWPKLNRYGPYEITAVAGETYFFKEGQETTGIISTPLAVLHGITYSIGFMEPSAAKQELSTYRYIQPIVQSVRSCQEVCK